jgi:hypothetical protein
VKNAHRRFPDAGPFRSRAGALVTVLGQVSNTAYDAAAAIAALRAELASSQTELTRTVDIAASATKMPTPTQPSDQLSRCRLHSYDDCSAMAPLACA